jgi:hypothetical protein
MSLVGACLIGMALPAGVAHAANPCLTGSPDPVAFGLQEVGSTTVIKFKVSDSKCPVGPGEEIKILREESKGGSPYLSVWKGGMDECLGYKWTEANETVPCKTEFAFEPGEPGTFEKEWEYLYNGGTYVVKLTGSAKGKGSC